MNRYADWRSRLSAYVAEAARTPFRPGRHDCALFAAGAVKAITGRDLARGHRSTYRSLAKGRAILEELGFDSPADMAAAHFEAVPVARAMPGDLAEVIDLDGSEALGVVQGGRIYVLGLNGIGTVPLTAAKRVFRV